MRAAKIAAEDVVHRLDGDGIWVVLRWRDFSSQNEGLQRTRAIHNVNDRLGRIFHLADVLGRNGALLPSFEQLFELRREFAQGCIAYNDEGGIIGPEPGVVKFRQVRAGQLGDTFFGARAGQRIAVSVVLSVKQARKDTKRHGDWSYFLALNTGDPLLLLAQEIRFRESRMQDDIGIQIERAIQIALQS